MNNKNLHRNRNKGLVGASVPTAKIKFRDYRHYPASILGACSFRDAYDDEPDGAFFAIAEEQGMMDALIAMATWEHANTVFKGKK